MAHKLNQAEQRVLEQCFIFCGVENKTGVAEEFGNKQKFLKGSIIYSPNANKKRNKHPHIQKLHMRENSFLLSP